MPSSNGEGIIDDIANLSIDRPVHLPVKARHHARDITREFIKAAETLHVGQLVKDASFSLFDSVQAIEIMDPKMDTGYLRPGETLEDNYDVSRDLLPEEIIWIMDQLICYQSAWHQGYSLSQNVLTSIYIDNLLSQARPPGLRPVFRNEGGKVPNELTLRALAPFCIGLIKSCDMTVEIITASQYYEEEDFNTQIFGKDLLTDFADQDFWDFELDCETWLKIQYDKGALEREHCEALLARLKLNIKLLEIVLPNPTVGPLDGVFFDASFGGLLDCIARTHALGKPVPEAFSPKMQRKLASTVPPRPVATVPFNEACSLMRKLRSDLDEAVLADALEQPISIHDVEAFLWAFSSREALALPRAVLQMFLFGEGKLAAPTEAGIQTLLWTELYSHTPMENFTEDFWEVEHTKDKRYVVARLVDNWRETAMGVYSDVLRSLCQNPCRMRRCLTNMIAEVDALNAKLLESLYPDPLTFAREDGLIQTCNPDLPRYIRWLLVTVTRALQQRVVDWVLALGFEQNLYRDDELAALYHFKCTRSAYVRESIEAVIEVGKQHRIDLESNPDPSLYLALLERERLAAAEESVVLALSTLYTSLSALGISPIATTRSLESSQFQLRMRHFTCQSNPTIPHLLLKDLHAIATCSRPTQPLLPPLIHALLSVEGAVSDLGRLKSNKAALDNFLTSVGLAATDATLDYWKGRLVELHREGFLVSVWVKRLKDALERYGEEGIRTRIVVEMPKNGGRFVVPMKVQVI